MITLALILTSTQLVAQQAPPNLTTEARASATAVSETPVIDGNLSESSWQNAQVLTGFVQQEPMEGEPGSEDGLNDTVADGGNGADSLAGLGGNEDGDPGLSRGDSDGCGGCSLSTKRSGLFWPAMVFRR